MAWQGQHPLGRPRLVRALVVALLSAAAIGWALASGAFHAPGLLAVFLLFGGMGIASALRRPTGGGPTRKLRADERGLSVDGALAVPRRDIRAAIVSESDVEHGAAVHLHARRPWRSCSVFVPSREEADEVVLALGLGHPDDLVRLRALPPWAKHIRWLTVLLTTSPWFLFNVVRFIPPWGVVVLAGLYAFIALPLVMPQYVEVAADGVLVTWLGSSTFLPFRAIDEATASSVGVVLRTSDGREHDIRLTQTDGGRDVERDALLARIEAGVRRQRDAQRGSEEALLARGGRSVAEWVAAMRALGASDAGGYRAAAIPRERLWEILEDPTSEASARAGAAIALHATVRDDAARTRLATVAARTAAPSLRVAIEALERIEPEPAADERVRVAIEASSAMADAERLLEEGAEEAEARRRAG